MARFDTEVVLVTGAAQGIGRGIAEAFAAEGARVVVADLDGAAAGATASAIGPAAMSRRLDVTDEAEVETGVARVIERFGRIDSFVSNAGIQVIGAVHELALADWRRVLAVHLDGAFLVTKACLPHMYGRGRGSAIYIGSVHSKLASRLKAPYVTAKHGLLGLCRVVAKEAAPHGVRANVVCPGFVRTPLVERQIPQQAAELGITEDEVVRDVMLGQTVDGVFTTIDDVAEAVLFLAGFGTHALTGQSIMVTHGWHMD